VHRGEQVGGLGAQRPRWQTLDRGGEQPVGLLGVAGAKVMLCASDSSRRGVAAEADCQLDEFSGS
jgi:hypothetical protein